MKKQKMTKDERIAELERKLAESNALSILSQSQAYNNIEKCGDSLVGSACIVSIVFLGGRKPMESFGVNDGLSAATIAALKADIKRSLDIAMNHPVNKLKV